MRQPDPSKPIMARSTRRRTLPFSAFIFHLHPRTVPSDTLRFTLSFGLGGMTVTLVMLLFATGLLQLLSYSPQTGEAYSSILQMYQPGGLGGFIRNCHYWAGNLAVILAFLHLLRVLLTGALTGPRRYNWLVGIALFLLLLFANFTGYLMPWDQLAYWAVTIFTAMLSYIPAIGDGLTTLLRGGDEVGPHTLATFYAIHIGIIPGIMILLLFYHFWLVRKAGGLIRSGESESPERAGERLPTVPHLLLREAAVGCSLLALVLLFSALVDAPLGLEANPGQSPNPAKAAWYFMGLQELLLHLHPSFAICLVPALILLFFLLLPFWKNSILPGAVWFGGRGGVKIAIMSGCAGAVLAFLAVLLDNILLENSDVHGATWLQRGVLPTVAFCLVTAVFFLLLRKGKGCSAAEGLMGVALLICSSVLTLTGVGIWLRGPGMALAW